jgi:hypothetical protein
MNTIVNARKGHHRRKRRHDSPTPSVKHETDHGRGEPICRMGRRHAPASTQPDKATSVSKSDARPGAIDRMLNRVADQTIRQRDREKQQESAYTTTPTAFATKNSERDRGRQKKPTWGRQLRHQPVEKPIR